MIDINEKYALDTDKYNYIICEKRVVKDKASMNYGQTFYDQIAYCGTLEQLRTYLFEREVKSNQLLENIEACIKLKNELRAIPNVVKQ